MVSMVMQTMHGGDGDADDGGHGDADDGDMVVQMVVT